MTSLCAQMSVFVCVGLLVFFCCLFFLHNQLCSEAAQALVGMSDLCIDDPASSSSLRSRTAVFACGSPYRAAADVLHMARLQLDPRGKHFRAFVLSVMNNAAWQDMLRACGCSRKFLLRKLTAAVVRGTGASPLCKRVLFETLSLLDCSVHEKDWTLHVRVRSRHVQSKHVQSKHVRSRHVQSKHAYMSRRNCFFPFVQDCLRILLAVCDMAPSLARIPVDLRRRCCFQDVVQT